MAPMVFTAVFFFLFNVRRTDAVSKSRIPTLQLSLTTDLYFVCNMAAFDPEKPPYSIHAMQIIAKFGSDESEKILATLDFSSGARPSKYLNNTVRLYKITGSAKSGNDLDWWLKLALLGVDSKDYGVYRCEVTYSEDAADNKPQRWKSNGLYYLRNSDPNQSFMGLELQMQKSLDLQCEYTSPDAEDVVTKMEFLELASSGSTAKLAMWSRDGPQYSSTRVMCFPRKFFRPFFSLGAHLQNVTCDDVHFFFQCRVETERTEDALTSSPQQFRLDGCMDADSPTPETETANPGSAAGEDRGDYDGGANGAKTWVIIIGVLLPLVLVLVLVVLYICRHKQRQGHYRVAEREDKNLTDVTDGMASKTLLNGEQGAVRDHNDIAVFPSAARVDFDIPRIPPDVGLHGSHQKKNQDQHEADNATDAEIHPDFDDNLQGRDLPE